MRTTIVEATLRESASCPLESDPSIGRSPVIRTGLVMFPTAAVVAMLVARTIAVRGEPAFVGQDLGVCARTDLASLGFVL